MRTYRHLVLRKETLTDLSADELGTVGGGTVEPMPSRGCIGVASGPVCQTVVRPCSAGCPTAYGC